MSLVGGILAKDDEYVTKVMKDITKKFGESVFMTGKEALDMPHNVLSVSPSIDLVLRGTSSKGGIPDGTIATISGKPKSGKSTSILSFCAECQRPENGSRHIYYLDIEHRIKEMNLKGIKGLNYTDKFTLVRSTKEKILNAEDYLTIAETIVNTHPNAIIVLDSSSALCAEKERTDEITGSARNVGPKLLATFLRKVSNIIPVNKVTIIVIMHLIANTSGYGPSMMEDGGNKIQYALDTKLRLAKSEKWTVGSGDNEKTIGLIITWQILTSALGAAPGEEVQSYIRFGVGIDHLQEWISMATDIGLIKKSGAWYAFGEHKAQGQENMYELFNQNEQLKSELITKVRDMMYGAA